MMETTHHSKRSDLPENENRCIIFCNVKHEARLTGGARSMRDGGYSYRVEIELGMGQPLLSMRLFCPRCVRSRQ